MRDNYGKTSGLDLDETLVYATENRLVGIREDFYVGPYIVYKRPGLDSFIDFCFTNFKVAVWTSSSEDYAEGVVSEIFCGRSLEFVFSRNRCIRKFNPETFDYYWIKDLAKVKSRGFKLESIIMVDDTPAKLSRNYGNLVYIRPFEGAPDDVELEYLAGYLQELKHEANIRKVEKRGWRVKFAKKC